MPLESIYRVFPMVYRRDMFVHRAAAALLCIAAGAVTAEASPIYFISPGLDGPELSLDVNHPIFWNITPQPGSSYELGGTTFGMRERPHTSGTTTLSIWLGAPDDPPLASVTLSQAQFEALHPGNDRNLAMVPYALTLPQVELQPGLNYTIGLTSTAPDGPNDRYLINLPSYMVFRDGGGNPVSSAPLYAFGPGMDVPEPSSWALLAAGIALVAVPRVRRAA